MILGALTIAAAKTRYKISASKRLNPPQVAYLTPVAAQQGRPGRCKAILGDGLMGIVAPL